MDKLAPLFVAIWTGLVFTTIFAIDNPLINDDNVFASRPGILLGLAMVYVAGALALIFLGRFLCRKAGIKRLERNGFYSQEYFPNRNFYFSSDGNDLALDKRTKRIGFSNASKVFIFRFADIFDFNVNVEKGGLTGKNKIIILQFFMGFKGSVIVNVRAANQDNALEMLRALRGVVQDARLVAASRRLAELCALQSLPDLGFEQPTGDNPDIETPLMTAEERAKEEERRRQAELERFRRLAMERKRQREEELQRQALLAEEAEQKPQQPAQTTPPAQPAEQQPEGGQPAPKTDAASTPPQNPAAPPKTDQ